VNIPDGGAARAGVVLLAVGYPVSVAVLLRLLPVYRRRRRGWFLALVSGLSTLVVGWLLLGRPGAAALNAAGLVAAVAAWLWTGRANR
jgi:uncharacterized membrane protein HdeD (DUF308 family)